MNLAHKHATVVAYVALVVALSGSAYAVGTVTSADIVNDTIRSADLKNGAAVKSVDVKDALSGSDAINANQLDGKDATGIGVNGLQRVEAMSAEDSISPKQVTASCPTGKVLTGTGFDIFGAKTGSSPNVQTDVVIDFVIPGSSSVTVAAYEEETISTAWHVKAIAICATAP